MVVDNTSSSSGTGLTCLGKMASVLMILCLLAAGGFVFWKSSQKPAHPGQTGTPPTGTPSNGTGAGGGSGPGQKAPPDAPAQAFETKELTETRAAVPQLPPAGTYVPKDNILDVEISQYAGYAGLIVANGGLEPNENSLFQTQYGFKVRLKVSEADTWDTLQSGKLAATATTADVLAVYGRPLRAVVPAQIGFSRGADGVVVRKEFTRINALKGQVLAAAQFTEADFFIRYLAQEAGLGVAMLPNLEAAPDPEKLNLVYCADAFGAGDLFLRALKAHSRKLAGFVGWAPKTTEVVAASEGQAVQLVSNKNLLIIADVLLVNKGFAAANPKMVEGLVRGLLEGNRLVRDQAAAQLGTIGKAFKWDAAKTQAELAKVHLSNLPENLAFFSGSIAMAGSFGGIYQSAVLSYGPELIKNAVDSDFFADPQFLKNLEQGGLFKDQKISIAPIQTGGAAAAEGSPLLSKDIRFFFQPNSADLDLKNPENLKQLADIKELLQVSPGSTIVLVGHVDNAMVPDFKKRGGDDLVRKMALKAIELSKSRAQEIRRLLVERHQLDTKRLETLGKGWEEPAGPDPERNRRVEVQWFTLE